MAKRVSLFWMLSCLCVNIAWSQVQITLKPIKNKQATANSLSVTRSPSSTTKRATKSSIKSKETVKIPVEVAKKDKVSMDKGGLSKPMSTDLNAELAASKESNRATSENLRPEELRPANKKKRKMQRIISGPTESVEVPDAVDWDHNKTRQIEAGKELNEKINNEMGRTKIDD